MAGASAQETQRVSRPGAILFGAISANKYCPSPWPHRRMGRASGDCAAASAEYAARKSNGSIAPSLIQRAIMRWIISQSLQLDVFADRGDPGRGTGIVLAPARRARDADRTEQRAARLDHQPAADGGDARTAADAALRPSRLGYLGQL